MPTVTETQISALAHCAEARCPGNAQQPVPGLRRETSFTYAELNGTTEGSIPGFERSTVGVHFADEADAVCEHCQGVRLITDQKRINHAPLSGHDPRGLLAIQDAATRGDL